MSSAITELLLRHELGDFPTRVRARLDEIFAEDPPDALERLQRAAEYLGLDGVTPETLARVEEQSRAREERSRVSTSTCENVSTAKGEVPA